MTNNSLEFLQNKKDITDNCLLVALSTIEHVQQYSVCKV